MAFIKPVSFKALLGRWWKNKVHQPTSDHRVLRSEKSRCVCFVV